MDKKILIGVLLAIFVMVSVSMVSAVNTQTKEKKELKKIDSPLFKLRTEEATKEKTQDMKISFRNIIANFLENRLFMRHSIFNDKDGGDEEPLGPSWPPYCTYNKFCD